MSVSAWSARGNGIFKTSPFSVRFFSENLIRNGVSSGNILLYVARLSLPTLLPDFTSTGNTEFHTYDIFNLLLLLFYLILKHKP
jgi:hypothetical protein